MKFGPYSFEKSAEKSVVRRLAVPALIAAAASAGLAYALVKRLKPEPEPPSQWNINWVELTDFKKPETPAKQGSTAVPATSGDAPKKEKP